MQDDAQEPGALRDRGACRRASWDSHPPNGCNRRDGASRRDSPGMEEQAAREAETIQVKKEGGKKERK